MTHTHPALSVVIPAWNSAAILPGTLERIRPQLADGDELIVVDDASTDDTAAVAEREGARVVRLESNSGPALARTRGAEAARGEVVVFTDTDVWLPGGALQTIRDAFADPEFHALQGVFDAACPFDNLVSQYKNLYNRFVLVNLPDQIDTTYTSLTAVRRGTLFACGGFDCQIRRPSVEDRTLGLNLVGAGHAIHLRRDLAVIHNKRMTLRGFVRNQFTRSRDLMKLKLRSRANPQRGERGRYGTNTRRAMLRLPAAYLLLASLAALPLGGLLSAPSARWTWIGLGAAASLGFLVLFLLLASDFLSALRKEKGWRFALRAVDLNFLDAVVSGAGVLMGAFEYKVLSRRY